MKKIGPSILGVSDETIVNVTNKLLSSGCDFIHYDVMDGKFVLNTSFSIDHFKFLKGNIDNKDAFFDVHLMTFDLENHIKEYGEVKANNITIHYEACHKEDIIPYINLIKSYSSKAGLAINPSTDVKEILEFLPYLDLVLVMSVVPGKGGQSFIESSLEKISYLKEYKKKHNLNYLIEVDGGINDKTIIKAREAGCELFVVGSFIIKSSSYKEALEKLKND